MREDLDVIGVLKVTGTSQQRILTLASSAPVIHWEQLASRDAIKKQASVDVRGM